MNVVFIGASQFGLRCLEVARDIGSCEVVGVVSARKKFSISYRPEGVVNVLHSDFRSFCIDQGIPVRIIDKGMKDEGLLEEVREWKPDCFLVVGWYHMVPKEWRQVAPAYGLHASLLPDYSGGAPLVWAMINGEPETGISLFEFDGGVDSGPIVGQASTSILENDDIASLYGRIEELGIDLIVEHLPRIANGSATKRVQDESKRRLFPQRSPEDGQVDWAQGRREIRDFVRAQTKPYPGAFGHLDGKKVMIWKVSLVSEENYPDGLSDMVNGECLERYVRTADGFVCLEEISIGGVDYSGGDIADLVGKGRFAPVLLKE